MTEYIRSEEERLDDIKMGRDAKQRKDESKTKITDTNNDKEILDQALKLSDKKLMVTAEQKLEVALTSLSEEKEKNRELTKDLSFARADIVGLQAQLKDKDELLKKLSFTSSNKISVDEKVEKVLHELSKYESLYKVFPSYLVTHERIESVVVDPVNKKVWLKDMYSIDEQDKLIVMVYREMQERNKHEELDKQIVAKKFPEVLEID